MTPEQLEEGRRLLADATPGPWERNRNDKLDTRWINGAVEDLDVVCDLDEANVSPEQQWANAAAIVWAVNNATALMDEAENAANSMQDLVDQIKKVEAERDDYKAGAEAEASWADQLKDELNKAEVERSHYREESVAHFSALQGQYQENDRLKAQLEALREDGDPTPTKDLEDM